MPQQQAAQQQAQGDLQRLNGRLASLEALQQAALDPGTGTAEWLKEHNLAERPRLAEGLKVEAGWELAVETVLGADLQAVLLDDFNGLDLKGLGIPDLYPSQKDCIWMLKQNGGGIADHEVGGGKTLIMCCAAYEMKRLGLANKPLITGLKANIHEIAQTFATAYNPAFAAEVRVPEGSLPPMPLLHASPCLAALPQH